MDKPRTANPNQPIQPSDRLVYLLTHDLAFAGHISEQIIHFGYFVQQIRNLKSLPSAYADQNPQNVLIDISPNSKPGYEEQIFSELASLPQSPKHLIFTSDNDDQAVRFQSIQSGGAAFFNKPINIVRLIDTLDALNRRTLSTQPSRVLIIENQLAVASYYQMVLKMSGMDAQIATNPSAVLDQIREVHPDLILMSTFLVEIDAVVLARVIRQMEEFVGIPIIFLSNEDDFEKRKEVLDLGGDDFLVKPIKAPHLTAVVRSRLERSKTLRSYMVRDSLTNLLNHTAFRSVLSQEVNRCKRQNTPLALAMLDIDHFKTVNDTYGHAAGDSAIKVLSRLLKQRLRKSDIIGRYGGDEFVALLLDCEPEVAVRIMDEIRVHFSEIEFYPNEARSLSLTFSCGIATFPKHQSAESLSDSADQALYSAKAGQRNRVIVAYP